MISINFQIRFTVIQLILTGFSGWAIASDEFQPAEIEFFESEIRPVLVENCYECHSGKKAKVGLRLDSRQSILKGSDYQKVIDLSDPKNSQLLHAVKHTGPGTMKMPKDRTKLEDPSIQALEKWITMGLPWPTEKSVDPEVDPKAHWSFQPVLRPEIPEEFSGNPIDYFIRKKLQAAGLTSAPKADRYTLNRRAHFGLTGLPPKADAMDEFINSQRTEKELWSSQIDELLNSPHYGERWARHWMDVARYSDTKGYEAGGRERRFIYSYTYRNWLIKAFNGDMPFDQFVKYQLAAEQLVNGNSPEKHHLAALGFVTLSKNGRTDLVIDDRLDTTFRGFMGLTVACAKCHDHKFDPISTKEYYGLYGVFANSIEPANKPIIGEPKQGPKYEAYLKELAKKQKVVDDFLEPKLAKIAKENPNIANRRAALVGKLDREARKKMQNLQRVVDKFVADQQMEPDKALTIEDRDSPAPQHVFIRGNPGRQGELADSKFLSIISGENTAPFTKGSGRLEMANAIADSNNPLTPRVIVNRIWAWHFGEGLVKTVSDFGTQGELPSHPELLDYLATWFVENGWSIKKLHRLILESETFQQSSDHPRQTEFADIDPENRLLWKMNRRRLDLEQMRDGILDVSGNLNAQMFGRTVKIFEEPFAKRRTVYAYIDRQNLNPVFRNFDFSNPQETTGRRPSTTIPMQALFSMNSHFVQAQSETLVKKAASASDKIDALHRAVFARSPDEKHRALAESFISSSSAKQNHSSQTLSQWSYGWGKTNSKGFTEFTPFKHWTGDRWQCETEWPLKNDKRSYLFIDAQGNGHVGDDSDHSLIYRWKAPRDLSLRISGKVLRANVGKGDGVRARMIHSEKGIFFSGDLPETIPEIKTAIDLVEIKGGDTIDFVIDSGPSGNCAFDSVNWQPEIEEVGSGKERWSFNKQFSGPVESSNPWEDYAQALLISNQFQFID